MTRKLDPARSPLSLYGSELPSAGAGRLDTGAVRQRDGFLG